MELYDHGVNLCKALYFVNCNYTAITVDKYVIMPNHVHITVMVSGASGKPRPTCTIPVGNGS